MIVGRRHTDRFGCLVGTDPAGPYLNAGRAPCLLAFHGFTGTTSEIRPVLDRVAERGYAVHAPLLPGHGTEPGHLQDATFAHWVEGMRIELRAAVRRHGAVVLCGFSLGSLIALELAAEAEPGVRGLVALGNAITLSPPLRAALGFFDRRAAVPDWYLLKLWSADVQDRQQRGKIVSYDRDPLRAAVEVYRGGRRVEPRLPLVRCPALVIHGGKDRVCPPANARRVAERLGTRSVETKLYPNSAHLVAADVDRDLVAEDVARFVDAVAASELPAATGSA